MLRSPDTLPPNRVVSVVLQPGQAVRWIWSTSADGTSYVSGYTVVGGALGIRRKKRKSGSDPNSF